MLARRENQNRSPESEVTTSRYSSNCKRDHHGIMTHPVRARGCLERTPPRAHTLSAPLPHMFRRANTGVYSGNRPSDFWGQYHSFRHLHPKRQHTAASMKLKVLSRMMIKKNKIKMIALFGAPPSTLDYTKYRNEMARNGDF